MQNNEEIFILHAYRPFLTFLSVYKAANFRNIDDQRIFARNILHAVGATLLIVLTVWFMSVQLMVFVNCNFDLNVGGAQFSFFLCCAPAFCVHLLLIWNFDEVMATIGCLQTIVVEREFILLFHFCARTIDYLFLSTFFHRSQDLLKAVGEL